MVSRGPRRYKYLMYFVAAFISCYLIQNVLFNRLMGADQYYITGGTFIYFLSPIITDVVAEVYGYRVARQMLWCGLIAMLFMGLCIGIFLVAPYPSFWHKVIKAYSTALGSLPRTAIAGSLSVFIGQLINAYLVSKWKILTEGRYFWLRSLGSSLIGDTATVIISILGAFGGRISAALFLHNIVPELIVMVVFAAFGAIPASFLARKVAKAEGLNNYDIGVNFNPFKLGVNQANLDKND